VILDQNQKEIIRVGRYYGPGRTNNEAEAFAMRDAVQCLARLRRSRMKEGFPVRVFGDSQLMIRFATRLYKKPHRQSIYWALEDIRRAEASISHPVAYRHVTRDANTVPDDMARRALEEKTDIIFWNGVVPADAPPN
jgi:ribonuclease HI